MLREILKTKEKDHARIVRGLFAYWFNLIDLDRFIEFVGDTKEGVRLKDIARTNGYILKNCKLYAYAAYMARMHDMRPPKPSAYGVTLRDAALLRKFKLHHLDTALYRSFTLKEFDRMLHHITEVDPAMRNYVGKFISKKMSFLIKSYNIPRADIETALKEAAIIALYKQYPRYENHLHFTNVAKAAIHNAGMSFISHHTSKGRQRLMRNDEGMHESVHVDIEAVSDVESPEPYGTAFKEQLEGLVALESKMPEKTKQFLLCAAGHHHEGLSAFMQRDNSDAVEEMSYEKYMKQVRAYFKVTPEQVERVYRKIRKELS